MNVPAWGWYLTLGLMAIALFIDVFVIARRPHVPSMKEAGRHLAFYVALAITTGSIWLLHRFAPDAGRATELLVLLVANALATLARFALLSTWFALRPARVPDPFEGSPS